MEEGHNFTGMDSPASDSHEEGLKRNEKLKIYLSDSLVSAGPGLLHNPVVIGAGPLSGHSIGHCFAQMANSVLRLRALR